MSFEKLRPIQDHATVVTCLPSGSGRDTGVCETLRSWGIVVFFVFGCDLCIY